MKANLTKKQLMLVVGIFVVFFAALATLAFVLSSRSLDDRTRGKSEGDDIEYCGDVVHDDCLPTPGVCGTLHERVFAENILEWPSGSFCTLGQVNPESPVFPEAGEKTTWECLGQDGKVDSCWAEREISEVEPEPPECGDLDKSKFPHTTEVWPSKNFCEVGTVSPENPTFPAKGARVTWECIGEDDTKVTCDASRDNDPVQPEAPKCGELDKRNFSHSTEAWPTRNFCAVGSVNPPNPAFPNKGGSITWECVSEDDQKVSCRATRDTTPVTPPPEELPETSLFNFVGFGLGAICFAISAFLLLQKHEVEKFDNEVNLLTNEPVGKISMKSKVSPRSKRKDSN